MTHDALHWEQRLWSSGHRVTRQRAHILEAVCAGNGHTPLGEIYLRVQRADRSIDRSTVYRALRLFVDLGLVVAADTGSDETYYEVAKLEAHHHLVCRRCGQEQEIDDAALQAMFNEVFQRHGFHVATDHLVLFGFCENCRAEERLNREN
ncbi:MAG: transcriptional repressor [Chloroflexia bacterium]|nr:transcriptional repressor [Chloroflexia bacterium]